MSSELTAFATSVPEGCKPRCPGCAHRGWERSRSEDQKAAWLAKALSPWSEAIEPVRGANSDERWGYRRRVCLRAEWSGSEWKLGLRVRAARDSYDYELVEIPECPVHADYVNVMMREFSRHLPGPDLLALAFVQVTGTLATLVVKSSEAPDLSRLFSPGAALDPVKLGLTGVYLNLNPAAGERVTASRGWKRIWGEAYAQEGSLTYGPDSFQQLVPRLYEDSLLEASRFLAPDPSFAVVDLCSGLGRSLQIWSRCTDACIGVELGGEAVALSEKNAPGVTVLRGRASDRVPQLQSWLREKGLEALIYANPPRLGLEAEVIEWMSNQARPLRFAYLSCSAGTLARDLEALAKAGYAVRRIIPYDFFPQTHHVESLALLERVSDSTGSVRADLGSRRFSRAD